MKNTATALLIAVQFIESRSQDDELDDDVAVLEAIAAELQEATADEKMQLKLAAQKMGSFSLLDKFGMSHAQLSDCILSQGYDKV